MDTETAMKWLTDLGFDQIRLKGNYITGRPVCHENSDNMFGFCFYVDSERWFCFTRGCHERCGSDRVGLVAAIKKITRQEAHAILDDEIIETTTDPVMGAIKKFHRYRQIIDEPEPLPSEVAVALLNKCTRCSYLEDRGFSPEMDEKFTTLFCPIYPLKNRIIFPVFQHSLLVGFSGRVEGDPKNEPKWKHFNLQTQKLLFNWDEAISSKTVFVVEGIIDAISMIEAGHTNTVALFGTNCSSYNQRRLATHFNTVYLLLDNDPPGQKAAISLQSKLSWRVRTQTIKPPIHDVGEMTPDEINEMLLEHTETLDAN